MRVWSRVTLNEYQQLPLRAHALLAQVPIHDVWRVELPGGGPNRTIQDVRALFTNAIESADLSPMIRALFRIRTAIGRVFRWDVPRADREKHSFRRHMSEQDHHESLVEPGSPDGPFAVLYVHATESVSEVRNATVHAFSVMALETTTHGYCLTWALYVLPVSRMTAAYMALIDPFRRLLIYPAILRGVHSRWLAAYGSAA